MPDLTFWSRWTIKLINHISIVTDQFDHTHTSDITHTHTSTAVESEATGGLKLLNKELRQDDLISPQRIVPILPVEHQVVLVIRI